MPAKLSPREAGMASPRLDEIASEIRTTWARVERDTAITRERLCEARDICRKNRVSFITWIATGNIGISQAQVYRLLGPDLVVVERKTHGHDGELIVGKVAQNQDVETDYGKARFFGTEAPSQTPAWHEPQVLLYQGNSLDRLKEINEAWVEVDICITSPPYFQKFDYGLHGQCGHEDTVADFIATQVLVFREVRRLLVEGGTCFIVIGDTSNNVSPIRDKSQRKSGNNVWLFRRKLQTDYREKETLSVPYRLAEALRQDGWIHRNTLIWDKGRSGVMGNSDTAPECHEYILHLIKWPQRTRPYGNTRPLHSSVLRHPPGSHPTHGCVFPVSLVEELLLSVGRREAPKGISQRSPGGLTVLDPYIGSGTVALAANPLGHVVYGFDLDCSIAAGECRRNGMTPWVSPG